MGFTESNKTLPLKYSILFSFSDGIVKINFSYLNLSPVSVIILLSVILITFVFLLIITFSFNINSSSIFCMICESPPDK